MRNRSILLTLTLFFHFNLNGQSADFEPGVFYDLGMEGASCLSSHQRAGIKNTLRKNISALKKAGKISEIENRFIVPLEWPLRLADGFTDIDYHGISAFVDHNSDFPSEVVDYNCGARSFDSPAGFNHSGTDLFLWPFGWSMMEEGRVDVVAAATGIIIGKLDGNYDMNCTGQDTTSWNAIYIRHDDGSVAWYGHLKSNSLTNTPIGGIVQQGDYLGKVGSSGASTGPHLHFEVYKEDDLINLVDPFEGTCNNLDTTTAWADQRPYFDSGINRISTHSALPEFASCPLPEIKNEANDFCEGDDVIFMVFLRDLVMGQTVYHQLIKPDGTVFTAWENTLENIDYQTASFSFEYAVIPNDPAIGRWKYRVDFLGTTASHTFNVCMSVDVTESEEPSTAINIFPNPTTGNINLELPNIAAQGYQIVIHNVDGKLILNDQIDGTPSNLQLDLSDYSSGIYMVSIYENGQNIATKRIVKI